MNTKQVNMVLFNSINPAKCNVLGTFPKNLIPSPLNHQQFPSCYVANTDNDSEPGEHWVAFYFPNENEYEFFDSYGQPPYTYQFPNLNSYMLSNYNSLILQSLTSNTCGHFCLYYLYSRSNGFSLRHIQNSFSKFDFKWNDKFVRNLIHRFLRPKLFKPFSSKPSNFITVQCSKSFSHFKNKYNKK